MTSIGTMIESLVWLLPPCALKNALLRLFGHRVSATARIGPIVAYDVARAVIGDGATIGPFNTFRSLRLLVMGADASIGSFNTVSSAPEFQTVNADVGTLVMGKGAIITNRHNIDCSGIVMLGDMAAVGGQRTTILSHEVDTMLNVQTAGMVTIGERSLVLTNCLLLKGSILPHHSLLVAKSMLSRSRKLEPAPGIYGGSPAEFIRENPLDGDSWFERTESATTTLRVDLPKRLDLASTVTMMARTDTTERSTARA